MHSVMNTLYTPTAFKTELKKKKTLNIYEELSDSGNGALRNKVTKAALDKGMIFMEDK